MTRMLFSLKPLFFSAALVAMLFLCGCATTTESLITATLVGAQAPGNEIQQIYYLGVFDPQEQVEPIIYRVRVHGQSSVISSQRFASGWVPASLVDSLSSKSGESLGFSTDGKVTSISETGADTGLSASRRLMLFGPEGFREAPADHRLVILMGSDPGKFFEAINTSLNTINQQMSSERNSDLEQQLVNLLLAIRDQRESLAIVKEGLQNNNKLEIK